MQTTDIPQGVMDDLTTFHGLDDDDRDRLLVAIFSALHEHRETGDDAVLGRLSRDIAFTMRLQRSDYYRKLVENSPREPSAIGRPVRDVMADLRRRQA